MLLYALDVCEPGSPEAIRTAVDRHILLLRLAGHGALERLSPILRQWGLPVSSVGYSAQRLAAYAQARPTEEGADAQSVFLWCDAILTRGQPILLTVAPRSLALLQSEWGEHREAETWKQPWDA